MTVATKDFFSYEELKQTAAYIQHRTHHQPQIGLILGSGLGALAEEIEAATYIPYAEIPNFPCSHVLGHAGRLIIGKLAQKTVMVMQGRVHFYEGYTMPHVTLPIRAMQLLGIKTLIVTNAAGGINPNFSPGDLMLIVDHLTLLGIGSHNPLRGPNLAELGPRFPDMTHPYDRDLINLARQVAARLELSLPDGVYAYVSGPSFETPADIRFLRAIGVDAVGMSTVPEVIVANHGAMQVLGLSGIANMALQEATQLEAETTHAEVLETGKIIVPKLLALLKGMLAEMD